MQLRFESREFPTNTINQKIQNFTNGKSNSIEGTIGELDAIIRHAIDDRSHDYNVYIANEGYDITIAGPLKEHLEINDGDLMLDDVKAYSTTKIKITRCETGSSCTISGGKKRRKRTFKSKSRRNLKRRKTRKHRR